MAYKEIWNTVFLGIGSNLGDRTKNIRNALCVLRKIQEIKIKKISKLYQTNPKGGPPQRRFLNAAIQINTILSPIKLLKVLKRVEKKIGRKKTVRFGPRIIDLDILLYGNKKITRKNLIIPHPRMNERGFVLKPLKEIMK